MGTHQKPNRLTDANRQAYEFHKECEAVGVFPDDPVVRRNAAIIAKAEQWHAEAQANEARNLLLKVAMLR